MKRLGIYTLLVVLGLSACSKEDPQVVETPIVTNLSTDIVLFEDSFQGEDIVLIGNQRLDFAMAFKNNLNGQKVELTALQGELPVVMEDQSGNRYDVFGQVVNGPDNGSQLAQLNTGMGFWFVFGAMYPGLEVYDATDLDVDLNEEVEEGWLVPIDAVAQASGFDAIQALSEPQFVDFDFLPTNNDEETFFVADNDLVIIVSLNGETKVYPHSILDWHEIVNDVVGGEQLSITYCPLTGTAKIFKQNDAFGVSGLLYNSNVIAFDRTTESLWTQLDAQCIYGPRIGEEIETVPFVEMPWSSWRRFQSSPKVMSDDTGINRDYNEYPYGDYRETDIVSFPLRYLDRRLPLKERVFSIIIDGQAKVYRMSTFDK